MLKIINFIFFLDITRYDTTIKEKEIASVGGLHPAVTYKFRVFAINFIDSSEATTPAVAKTQEEGELATAGTWKGFLLNAYNVLLCLIAPTEPPQNIKVSSAGPGELIVSWEVNFKIYYINSY